MAKGRFDESEDEYHGTPLEGVPPEKLEPFAGRFSPVHRERSGARTPEMEGGSAASLAERTAMDANTRLSDIVINDVMLRALRDIAQSAVSLPEVRAADYAQQIESYESFNKSGAYDRRIADLRERQQHAAAYEEVVPARLASAVTLLRSAAGKLVANINSVRQGLRASPHTIPHDLAGIHRALQDASMKDIRDTLAKIDRQLAGEEEKKLSDDDLRKLRGELEAVGGQFATARSFSQVVDQAAVVSDASLAIARGKVAPEAIGQMREDLRQLTDDIKKSGLPGITAAALTDQRGVR